MNVDPGLHRERTVECSGIAISILIPLLLRSLNNSDCRVTAFLAMTCGKNCSDKQ